MLGDFLCEPLYPVNQKETTTKESAYAKIAGYYLGNGHLMGSRRGRKRTGDWRYYAVVFTLNAEQPDIIKDLEEAVLAYGEASSYNIQDYEDDRKAVRFTVYGRGLAERLLEDFGRYSKEKYISDSFMRSSTRAERLALVGGYTSSDGCFDDSKKTVRVVSLNKGLMLDLSALLLSCGVKACCSKHQEPHQTEYGFVDRSYVCLISGADVKELLPYSPKITKYSEYSKSEILLSDKYAIFRVKSLSELEPVGDTSVYNMSVESDESYIVGGLAAHNCSLCNHRRRSFKDACEHVKNHKLMITPEGHQVFVINDRPRFHDISGVMVPADKVAFTLRKVASGQPLSGVELAELEGYTIPTGFYDSDGGAYSRRSKQSTLSKLAEMEKRVEAKVCDPSSSAFMKGSGFKNISKRLEDAIRTNPDKSLSVMKNMKVVLPLEVFLKLFSKNFSDTAESCMPDVKARMPGLFQRMHASGGECGAGSYDGTGGSHEGLASLLLGMGRSHSVDDDAVVRRVALVTLNGGGSPKLVKLSGEEDGLFEKLAREYGRYLLSFSEGLSDEAKRMVLVQKLV